MEKIIFLDIDGPLSYHNHVKDKITIEDNFSDIIIPYSWDKEECEALNEIIDKTDAKIVISSDWRLMYSFKNMKKIFRYHGIDSNVLLDYTSARNFWTKMSSPPMSFNRSYQVCKYVKDYKIKSWLAIDDLNLAEWFKVYKVPQWRHICVSGDFNTGCGRLSDKIEIVIERLNRK